MDDPKHNLLGGRIGVDQLRAYVSRIERLEAEVDGINCDKREVYSEAKAVGFCKKTLRRVILRRRKDKSDRDEEDELLALYEATLNDPLE